MKKIVVFGIKIYQKYLSPHKGYRCAYNYLHGGISCSEYGKRIIQKKGLVDGIKLTKKRIYECRDSMIFIRSQYEIQSDGTLKATASDISTCLRVGADGVDILDNVDRNNNNGQPSDCL